MPNNILLSTVAALIFGGAMLVSAAPAQAQVGVEIGPGGARIYEGRPYRPVIERRRYDRRVIVEDDDEDCRMVVRRRVNRFGEVVTRRTQVCD